MEYTTKEMKAGKPEIKTDKEESPYTITHKRGMYIVRYLKLNRLGTFLKDNFVDEFETLIGESVI